MPDVAVHWIILCVALALTIGVLFLFAGRQPNAGKLRLTATMLLLCTASFAFGLFIGLSS